MTARLLIGVILLAPLVAQAQPVDKDISGFLENRRLVSRLDADVSGDGTPDTILVAADDKKFEATVTVLLRPHGRSLTDNRQSGELQAIDALKLELSPLGPPTVKVAKGILIVEHLSGGATVRTDATYRYRFDAEEGRMRLIGVDGRRTGSTSTVMMSWNALTGARILKKDNGPERKTTHKPGQIWMDLTPTADELIDK